MLNVCNESDSFFVKPGNALRVRHFHAGTHFLEAIMKSSIGVVLVASLLSTPLVAFAQTNAPLTRAQVRDELVQLRNAGYNGNASDTAYPADLEAALTRVAAQQQAAPHSTGYGMESGGSSQAGQPKAADNEKPIYFGQ
jgi:hypothetical protein